MDAMECEDNHKEEELQRKVNELERDVIELKSMLTELTERPLEARQEEVASYLVCSHCEYYTLIYSSHSVSR